MPRPLTGPPAPSRAPVLAVNPVSPAERIIRAALAAPHAYESADGFAERAGFRNRHQLNRAIHRAGLPTYRTIAAFVRVLALRDHADLVHRSLCAETLEAGYEPAWAYRTIKRVTGKRWSEVRHLSHDQLVALALAMPERLRR